MSDIISNPTSYYYGSKYRTNNFFFNSIYSLDIELEKKFADVLFYGDLSRIIYASPEYNFKERGRKNESNLNLPFMSYWLNVISDETDRKLFSNQINVDGLDLGLTAANIKPQITPLHLEYDALVFFSQDRDLKYASYLINKLHSNENVVYYYLQVDGTETVVKIPAFLTYDVSYNPEFKEQDWLEENKIMSIAMTWNIDTLQLNVLNESIDEAYPILSITQQTIFDFLVTKNIIDRNDISNNEGILLQYFNPETLP